MSSTQYYVAASADGYIADRQNRLDWLLRYGFEAYQEHYDAFLAGVGALTMGAATYEFVLAEGGGWAYGDRPAWVFTHRELPRALPRRRPTGCARPRRPSGPRRARARARARTAGRRIRPG